MANLASNLLEFILDLLRNPEAAADFRADPQAALTAAGLDDVCPADVRGLIPVLEDYAPVGAGVAGLAHTSPAATAAAAPQVLRQPTLVSPAAAVPTAVSPAVTLPASDDVVEQLRYIQQTYTYNANTTIDVRDSVWAGQDVYQVFGDEAVLATGGSLAAGRDVEDATVDHSIEDAFNIDDSFNPENSGNTQIGTGNVNGDDADVDLENSGNSVDGDGNAVGRGNDVDNIDRSVEGDGNAVGRNSTADNSDRSVEVEDSTGVNVGDNNRVGDVASGEGNAVGNTVDIRNSGNDNSRDFDESFNDNSDNSDNSDRSVSDDDEFGDITTVSGSNSAAGDQITEDNDDYTATLDDSAVDFGRGSAVTGEDVDGDLIV
jgi:hypothetical protein